MEKIFSWKAKRAGAHITVIGSSANGAVRRVTGIVDISPNPRAFNVVATGKDGVQYELLT